MSESLITIAPRPGGQPGSARVQLPPGTKVALASLGCAKNLVDAEQMLGLLRFSGAELTTDREQADVIIVNTCSFIGPAKEESIETILDLARYKETGRCKVLVASGCLAQRYVAELQAELPEVDAFVGTGDYPRIAEVVQAALRGEKVTSVGRASGQPAQPYPEDLPRILSASGPSAYLKISEGCDHHCTFCIIPHLRGDMTSRPIESIVAEAEALAASGVKELVLIAQDSTAYGMDLYGKPRLADLLTALGEVKGIQWVRVMYAYPVHAERLIPAMAATPNVAKYLDMPLQHGSDKVLREMQRPGGSARIRELVAKLREGVPGLVLRSTFLLGFPGETEEDFQQLLSLLREIEFDHVGMFTYSQEEGTPAGERPDQVPEEVKQERFRRAMEVQQPIAFAKNKARVGQTLPVLIEKQVGPVRFQGRWEGQAPEVDGHVVVDVPEAASLRVGDLVPVRITHSRGYNLVGEWAPETKA